MEFLSERRRRSIQDAIDVLQQGLAERQSGDADYSESKLIQLVSYLAQMCELQEVRDLELGRKKGPASIFLGSLTETGAVLSKCPAANVTLM